MEGLSAVGDAALVEQIDDTVGEHLRVNTQIFMIVQSVQNSIWNATDTHLQCGTILHQILGNQFANFRLNVRNLACLMQWQIFADFSRKIKVGLVDDTIAKCARHLRIDLC